MAQTPGHLLVSMNVATLIATLARSLRHEAARRRDWLRLAAALSPGASVGWGAEVEGRAISIGEQTRVENQAWLHCPDRGNAGSHIRIGAHCRVWPGAGLYSAGGWIEIGNYSSLNSHVLVYGTGGVRIGNHVRIATHTVIVASMHRYERADITIREQGIEARGIVIQDDVWIGAGVTVLDGVEIGRGSIIAAGAVVTKNVEPFSVMAGVPARLLKRRGNAEPPPENHA